MGNYNNIYQLIVQQNNQFYLRLRRTSVKFLTTNVFFVSVDCSVGTVEIGVIFVKFIANN